MTSEEELEPGQRVRDRVTAEERGALTVKGAVRPVEAWEITGLAD